MLRMKSNENKSLSVVIECRGALYTRFHHLLPLYVRSGVNIWACVQATVVFVRTCDIYNNSVVVFRRLTDRFLNPIHVY